MVQGRGKTREVGVMTGMCNPLMQEKILLKSYEIKTIRPEQMKFYFINYLKKITSKVIDLVQNEKRKRNGMYSKKT